MTLKINKFKCRNCGAEFEGLKDNVPCPGCENKEVKLISSKDLELNSSCGGSCGGCTGCS